jgi:hypothetical protein
MKTIFLITGDTDKHVELAGRWLANRVAFLYKTPEEVSGVIPDLPVAVLAIDGTAGAIPQIRKHSKADVVHLHIGTKEIRKAQGAARFHHVESAKTPKASDVDFLRRLEAVWRSEKSVGKEQDGRTPIKLPV